MIAHLPPAEPPADDVDQVLELLRIAREQLQGAGWRLDRVAYLRALGERDAMALRVLIRSREHEAELWAGEVRALEERARALGLQV